MAAEDDTNTPLVPRDETAAILEQTFGDGDTISVDPDAITDTAIGAAMCGKILESSVEHTADDQDASTAADDYTGGPSRIDAAEGGHGKIPDRGHRETGRTAWHS
jgi:hypothetical protein